MHIPDGYLDPSIATITYLLSIAYLAYSLHRCKLSSESEKLSAITVFAATIFVAQMINWPIPGGTSLHFLGGALVGIVLGPWVGSVTIFLVLLVQCLIFHDGGITALGANTLNMAIVAVVSGYLIYRSTRRRMGGMLASFVAGWISVALAGLVCGVELGLSSNFIYNIYVTVPVMGGWHLALGLIEGLITSMVVRYLEARSPHYVGS
jgi:cobalt/nickel transport system permease protein